MRVIMKLVNQIEVTYPIVPNSNHLRDQEFIKEALIQVCCESEPPVWVEMWFPIAMVRHYLEQNPIRVKQANDILSKIILDHTKIWGGASHEALGALAIAEAVGLQFDSHRETMQAFTRILKVINRNKKWDHSTIALWKRAISAMTSRATPGGQDFTELYDRLEVPPWLPGYCLDLLCQLDVDDPTGVKHVSFDDGTTVVKMDIGAPDIWLAVRAAHELTLGEVQIRRFIKEHGLVRFIWLGMCYSEKLINRSAFLRMTAKPSLIKNLSMIEIMNLTEQWHSAGCPDLDKFIKVGGTVESFERHQQAEQERQAEIQRQKRRKPQPKPEPRAAAPVYVAPKPEPKPEPAALVPEGLDWDWVMAEFTGVEEVFPNLDPCIVRVIIVHGMLRSGDRVMPMGRLPSKKLPKLWKECEGPLCSDKGQFTGALEHLRRSGLIERKKGKYSLARAHPRNKEMHPILEQIEAVCQRYAS